MGKVEWEKFSPTGSENVLRLNSRIKQMGTSATQKQKYFLNNGKKQTEPMNPPKSTSSV